MKMIVDQLGLLSSPPREGKTDGKQRGWSEPRSNDTRGGYSVSDLTQKLQNLE
ncbi:hypothetical protein BY996DRAFT_6596115 [Phakopsora pachyrhizi]|nr:hypothetical protein BY996DRAFT_6596115 [Phakopsora pachyrhizi]